MRTFVVTALLVCVASSGLVSATGEKSVRDERLTTTSPKCSAAIKRLCSKLTEADLDICAEKHQGDNEGMDKCVKKAMGGVQHVEECQAKHIEELISEGCTHLKCKALARDLCGCDVLPQTIEAFTCWHHCWHGYQSEFSRYNCQRPPKLEL